MPMIKCIECGNSISDKSEICVHCGCPTKLSKISDINIDEKILYDYLSNGDYILGIKYIKDTLDIDLKDARNYVEQYKDNHPELKSSKVQLQNIPKCPMCGSTNISKISTISRATSIIGFGILSKKIGKQWQCNNPKCKHMW